MLVLSLLGLFLPGGSDPAALERALASVRPESIFADVQFIASDELEGRDTPSHGLRLAARYLRARVERLGFQPAGDDGFFDQYELERGGLDLAQSKTWLVRDGKERELALGPDYSSFGRGAHDLDGAIVFVGEGREEDLKGLDLKGKWALATDASSARTQAAFQARAERMERVKAAGALGTLTTLAPGAKDEDVKTRDERIGQMASFAGRASLRAPGEASGGPSDVSISLASGITRELLGAGAAPKVGADLGARLHHRTVARTPERLTLENVAALWPGSDPELRHEVLILSAHYDHEGIQDGQIYNGADDNGSGTSGLLAVADALAQSGPLRRSVLLLWVSGEEKGLLGSEAWTKAPTLPAEFHPVCDINIDMIGRNAPDKLLITPTKELKEYNGLTRLAESLGKLEGFPSLGSADEYWRRSDHMNFADNLHIPVAFLFSDVHEDYHEPTDDADKIDCDKIRRVVRLVVRMLDGLQGDRLSL